MDPLGNSVGLGPVAASAATYSFSFTDDVGDSGTVDFTTSAPVTASGVPITNISGSGTFDPTQGAASTYSIGGPINVPGADNLLLSTAPYVDSAGIGVSLTGPGGIFDYLLSTGGFSLCTSEGGCSPLGIQFTLTPVEVAPTPLPGALPLFATGLGALGLLGWRRKKKLAA
jgi:hypothetical protein